jgi:hypothetical protein
MEQNRTLERCWCATIHGYPIVVEEHRSDIAYTVEFYDGRVYPYGGEQTITYLPDGELLTVEMLSAKHAA